MRAEATGTSTIVATATAVPEHSATQAQVKEAFRRTIKLTSQRAEAVMALFDHSLVETRYAVYPLERFGERRSVGELTIEYRRHAVALGERVAADALRRAEVAAPEIDLVITVSCTGVILPSLDAHLINALGLRADVRRLPITELGCFAGAAALARASDFLRGAPEAKVLVVAVELASLSLQHSDLSPANLVSSALFGDGAAAAVLTGERRAGARILETRSHTFPSSTHALGFDLQDDGFHTVLTKDVPDLLRAGIRPVVDELTGRAGLTRADLSGFVLHTGGRKILEAMEEALELDRDQTQPSWDVLRDYGNQSSASVLFVLERWMTKRRPPRGAHALLAAFGPGLSAELMILEWC